MQKYHVDNCRTSDPEDGYSHLSKNCYVYDSNPFNSETFSTGIIYGEDLSHSRVMPGFRTRFPLIPEVSLESLSNVNLEFLNLSFHAFLDYLFENYTLDRNALSQAWQWHDYDYETGYEFTLGFSDPSFEYGEEGFGNREMLIIEINDDGDKSIEFRESMWDTEWHVYGCSNDGNYRHIMTEIDDGHDFETISHVTLSTCPAAVGKIIEKFSVPTSKYSW